MKFKEGDIVQRKQGGIKYRICAVLQNPCHYKATRLDNGAVWVFGKADEDSYEITDFTGYEPFYKVGQILIKKTGGPTIALICEVVLGAENEYHLYSCWEFDGRGNPLRHCSYYQKQLLEQFEISNFKWVVLNGDPKKTIRKVLRTKIEKMEQELLEHQTLLASLIYYETILEKEKKDE